MQSAIASATCPPVPRAAAGQASTSGSCYHRCKASLQKSVRHFRGSHPTRLQSAQVSSRHRRRNAQIVRSVLDVTEDTFEAEVLQADVPVLVDFWATWCGPCKLIAPLLGQLEKEFEGALKVVKVEADPCPNLVEKYKVYGLPTLVLFRDGQVVKGSQKEGALGKPVILKYLESYGVCPQTAL